MFDKLDIEIPFHPMFVQQFNSVREAGIAGRVNIQNYDFKAFEEVTFDRNGQPVRESIRSVTWDSISSGIAGLAVGFFPEGNGFNEWPHVRIKASPAKILQGHNVFGSECIRQGAYQMLFMFKMAFPRASQELDFEEATVRILDCTYSASLPSQFYMDRVLRTFESLAAARTKVNSSYDGYLQLSKSGAHTRQKIYKKHAEVLEQFADAKRRNQQHKMDVLGDKRLQDFALDKLRFEGTITRRKLEAIGVPVKLVEFLKFQDWFAATHDTTLCEYLWHQCFDKLFDQIKGHTMKNVDDSQIKLKIDAEYIRIKDDGKLCKRRANAVWQTYRNIKSEGYQALAKERNKTFFRNVGLLADIGLSRAFLKSLGPDKPEENIIAFVNLINIDFSAQRPDWYVEPKASYEKPQLKIVA